MRMRDTAAGPIGLPIEGSRTRLSVLAPAVPLALAAILWAVSLGSIDLGRMSDLGLVSVLPPGYFVALALLTVSFALALGNRDTPGWLLFLHVVLLVAIVYGTPSLAYGTLRYSWAWKHVGVVDYIQRHGTADTGASALAGLSANQNWPGFFTLGTLFTEAAGFGSALPIAQLAPLFFNLIDIGALLLILGAFVRDQRLRWLAVWVFFLGNWIGQDYFAPQAMSYFLLLVIVGICLTWFGTRPRPALKVAGSAPVGRLESWWGRLSGPPARGDQPALPSTPLQRVGLMAVVILLFGVIASSHQLTPIAAILSVGALVVAYRCGARSLPVLMAVITVMWISYMAWAFMSSNLQWIIHPLGQVNQNAAVTDLSRLSREQVTVALAARGLTALIGVLGLAGLVRRWRGGQRDIPYLVLAAAPFLMLAITSYGGEMAFRVYFLALPYVAFFAAALFFPRVTAGRSWRTPAAVVAMSAILLAGLLLSYYGRERMNYFTPNEVAAAQYLYETAPPRSLIIGASYNYPSQFRNYEQFTQVTLAGQGVARGQLQRVRDDPIAAVNRLVGSGSYSAVYLIFTRSQRAHIEMDNLLPPGTIDRFEQALRDSGEYRLVYQNPDADIFALDSQQGGSR